MPKPVELVVIGAGSAIFGKPDYKGVVDAMRRALAG